MSDKKSMKKNRKSKKYMKKNRKSKKSKRKAHYGGGKFNLLEADSKRIINMIEKDDITGIKKLMDLVKSYETTYGIEHKLKARANKNYRNHTKSLFQVIHTGLAQEDDLDTEYGNFVKNVNHVVTKIDDIDLSKKDTQFADASSNAINFVKINLTDLITQSDQK